MNPHNISDLLSKKTAKRLPDDLRQIVRWTSADWQAVGATPAEIRRILAAVELHNALREHDAREYADRITSPSAAMAYCLRAFSDLQHQNQEEFWIVTLNTKNEPIRRHQVTRGTLRNSLVHPREVFRPAIADSANCIIAVHNHPSGDVTPSDQDLQVTDRLEQSGETIGIPVIDHIVIGRPDRACSIKDWRLSR